MMLANGRHVAMPCTCQHGAGACRFRLRSHAAPSLRLRRSETVQHTQKAPGRCSVGVVAALPGTDNQERYQPKMSRVERNALRKQSQQLGKDITVVTIGRNGVSRNTLVSLGDALSGNELVKVRLGGNCEEEMEEVAEALTAGCDCIVVHSIGSTITVFRDKSLPRPLSSLLESAVQPEAPLTSEEERKLERRQRLNRVRAKERATMNLRPPAFDVVPPPSADQGGAAARLGLAALAASLALCQVPAADAAVSLAAAGNPAIVRGIERLEAGDSQDPDAPAVTTEQRQTSKLQQIQQQLQRIGTLVGIDQYDSARIQLREGPTSRLRKTLRETEEDFTSVSDSVVKDTVKSLEDLDRALREKRADDAVALVGKVQDDIGAVITGMAAVRR